MKQLDWEETFVDRGDGSQDHSGWEADNGFGNWYVVEMGFGSDSYVFTATFDGNLIADFDDEDDAKAAAEKHYAARITAALQGSVVVPEWQEVGGNPPPDDGSRFDAWCQKPGGSTIGVRFTDVSMRGDGSGFGFIDHTMEGPAWHYLGREDEVYPLWEMTHWMPRPAGPLTRQLNSPPPGSAPHNSGERLPSSDAATSGGEPVPRHDGNTATSAVPK